MKKLKNMKALDGKEMTTGAGKIGRGNQETTESQLVGLTTETGVMGHGTNRDVPTTRREMIGTTTRREDKGKTGGIAKEAGQSIEIHDMLRGTGKQKNTSTTTGNNSMTEVVTGKVNRITGRNNVGQNEIIEINVNTMNDHSIMVTGKASRGMSKVGQNIIIEVKPIENVSTTTDANLMTEVAGKANRTDKIAGMSKVGQNAIIEVTNASTTDDNLMTVTGTTMGGNSMTEVVAGKANRIDKIAGRSKVGQNTIIEVNRIVDNMQTGSHNHKKVTCRLTTTKRRGVVDKCYRWTNCVRVDLRGVLGAAQKSQTPGWTD
eukprot:TRINITY_DN67437_c9_g5_i1.p2 TRINITY_DN67437_c9_g5~~TRINITY_DN67437_c9_g5_i1.p2  ORF type:complete len:344 (+),score=29.40 TRINITY_DN67437_c9_g5_i1:80-1033(+)